MTKQLLLLLTFFFIASMGGAHATIVQSGNFTVNLDQYVPEQNGQPFPVPPSNVLQNPGFETGSLPPWTTDNWTVTNTDSYSGTYCAEDVQNHWIRQDFAPIPVGDINSVTMWERQPQGPAFGAVDFFYGATDYDEFLVAPGDPWTFIDMTSHLRGSGSLQSIRIWGYSGQAPELTKIDDVNIDTSTPTPTDRGSWGRIKGLYR